MVVVVSSGAATKIVATVVIITPVTAIVTGLAELDTHTCGKYAVGEKQSTNFVSIRSADENSD